MGERSKREGIFPLEFTRVPAAQQMLPPPDLHKMKPAAFPLPLSTQGTLCAGLQNPIPSPLSENVADLMRVSRLIVHANALHEN